MKVGSLASGRLRIVVLGYVVVGLIGGLWGITIQIHMVSDRLGNDVYFVEDSDDSPSCYDPIRDAVDVDPSYGLDFARAALERIGFGGRRAYHDGHPSRWRGPCADRVLDICAGAELLLNLCGANPLRPWLMEIPVRALVDEDPAFTQIRHLTEPGARERALLHTAFFSFGENIGHAGCAVPDDGLPWRPTRQPVALDVLPVTPGRPAGKFTTVMLWDSYAAPEYRGVRYGMKSDSFAPYLDLPERAGRVFELAVGSPSAPCTLLRQKGWTVCDPRGPTRDPWTYQRYVEASKAEFAVAKHGYVISGSGRSSRSLTTVTCSRTSTRTTVSTSGILRHAGRGQGITRSCPFCSAKSETSSGMPSRWRLSCPRRSMSSCAAASRSCHRRGSTAASGACSICRRRPGAGAARIRPTRRSRLTSRWPRDRSSRRSDAIARISFSSRTTRAAASTCCSRLRARSGLG